MRKTIRQKKILKNKKVNKIPQFSKNPQLKIIVTEVGYTCCLKILRMWLRLFFKVFFT